MLYFFFEGIVWWGYESQVVRGLRNFLDIKLTLCINHALVYDSQLGILGMQDNFGESSPNCQGSWWSSTASLKCHYDIGALHIKEERLKAKG